MKYTVPDYYKDFKCIADQCPATCCAGWQIVIDPVSQKKYRKCNTPFGNRLYNSINWKEGVFKQYNSRCAFLDENNLCDIYSEAGPGMLCKTCRNYPRHIEEFQNERELSLSISCPVVAEKLFTHNEPVTFLEKSNSKTEKEDERFDFLLYSILQDCRKEIISVLQSRKFSMQYRMAKVLTLSHDIQNRIDGNRIFDIQNVLDRYRSSNADKALRNKFLKFEKNNKEFPVQYVNLKEELFSLLNALEVLDQSWPDQIAIYKKTLFSGDTSFYFENQQKCQSIWKQNQKTDEPYWREIECEQLMVYFIYTYLCGAVYDCNVLAKVKMAIVSTLLIQDMEVAVQMLNNEPITLFDRTRIAWRFSRELEHSDTNLNRMEEMMSKSKTCELNHLLSLILM